MNTTAQDWIDVKKGDQVVFFTTPYTVKKIVKDGMYMRVVFRENPDTTYWYAQYSTATVVA